MLHFKFCFYSCSWINVNVILRNKNEYKYTTEHNYEVSCFEQKSASNSQEYGRL